VSAARVGKAVWACDRRTGRRTRLARAREIADVDFEGRRVVWTHVTRRGVVLREAVVGRRDRIVARRTLTHATGEVAVSSRGDLAWETRRGIVLKPFDAAPRWIHRRGDLGFEDGGTLRIGPADYTYVDLRPPPMRDGCPRRERFAPAAESDGIKAGKVLAAGADGFYATLDSGAVASLRADGTRVTWTNAGAPMSADLASRIRPSRRG
jgi:hypothetical protein